MRLYIQTDGRDVNDRPQLVWDHYAKEMKLHKTFNYSILVDGHFPERKEGKTGGGLLNIG